MGASWSAAAALGNLEPLQLDDSFPGEPGYAPFCEDPDWVVELASSLAFRERLRYRFKKSGHINVLESRTYKTWVKHLAREAPDSRAVGLLDSRVTLGATAKGRSSRQARCPMCWAGASILGAFTSLLSTTRATTLLDGAACRNLLVKCPFGSLTCRLLALGALMCTSPLLSFPGPSADGSVSCFCSQVTLNATRALRACLRLPVALST